MAHTPSIEERAKAVQLLLFDVDGVLTDGKILLDADGRESKRFDIKDGTALVWAQRLGLTVGFLSARSSTATALRAAQLGITLVHQGVPSKLQAYEQIVDELLLEDDRVAYMGDDILDLPVLTPGGPVHRAGRCRAGRSDARPLGEPGERRRRGRPRPH